MKVLVIDNYDSFTYNLVHYVEQILQQDVDVYRNDAIDIKQIEEYDKILLSPGPGIPDEANLLKPIIATYYPAKDILGVCLGHQAIVEVMGGKIYNTSDIYHGVAAPIEFKAPDALFQGLPKTVEVGRYHSWIAEPDSLPDVLEVTATTHQGDIMAVKHKEYALRGVQFHPESVLTPQGFQMIENWLNIAP